LPIDAVLLSKVESAERVQRSLSLLDGFGAPPGLAIWCMIETPLGVLEVREIAGAAYERPAATRHRPRPRHAGGEVEMHPIEDRQPISAGRQALGQVGGAENHAPRSATPPVLPPPAGRAASSVSTAKR